MKTFLLIGMLLIGLSGCRSKDKIEGQGERPTQTVLSTMESATFVFSEENDTATAPATDILRPEVRITIEEDEISPTQRVVLAFLNAVSEGDTDGAMNYWNPERLDEGIQRLIASWITGEHRFIVGGISYAGFFSPGDYRPLEADAPRVSNALVETWIDGEPGSFALEKIDHIWLISGWMVSDTVQPLPSL